MIDRRRCPSCTRRPSSELLQVPSASGPRCAMAADIAGSRPALLERSQIPRIPHIVAPLAPNSIAGPPYADRVDVAFTSPHGVALLHPGDPTFLAHYTPD